MKAKIITKSGLRRSKKSGLLTLLFFIVVIIKVSGQNCQIPFIFYNDTIPNSIVFVDYSPNATSWLWDFGDSAVSSLQFTNHTYTTSGEYNVCLTIFDSTQSCTDTFCHTVFVGNCQPFIYVFPCENSNIVQFLMGSNGEPTNLVWDFGDGTQSNEIDPLHTYNQQGTYYVCLTSYDTVQMCTSNFCYSILVGGSNPHVILSACDGNWSSSSTWANGHIPLQTDTVIITHNVILDNNVSVLPPGILIISSTGELCGNYNLDAQFITNGSMQVNNLTSEGDCVNHAYLGTEGSYSGSGSSSWQMDGPVCIGCPSVCNPTYTCCSGHFILYPDTIPHNWIVENQAVGIAPITYLWNWGDSTTSTGATPSHIYNTAGYYNICLTITDGGGCTSTYCDSAANIYKNGNAIINVNVILSPTSIVEQVQTDKSLTIYPNPSNGQFNIINENQNKINSIEIYNTFGERIYTIRNIKQQYEIDLSSYPKGIYFVKFDNGTKIYNRKVIVQ